MPPQTPVDVDWLVAHLRVLIAASSEATNVWPLAILSTDESWHNLRDAAL